MVSKIQTPPKKIATILVTFVILGVVALGIIYLLAPEQKLDEEITLLWWGNVTGPPVLSENFEKEFGVKVSIIDMSSESNMIDLLESGELDYDVVGASDITINELIKRGLISPINTKNIPNAKISTEECSNRPYNSEEYYMTPIMWLTNGLVFNTKYIPEDSDSWEILWNPEYTGKITLQDNRNDVIQAALQYIGHSVFPQNRFQLLEAKNFLIKQKSLIQGYENQLLIVGGLVSEDIWASHISSAMSSIAIAQNPSLKYIIPKEGSAILSLGLTVPIASKKKYTAEVFINYLLRPDNEAAMANYYFVAPCTKGTEGFLRPEFLNNPAIYPTREELSRLESSANYEATDEIVSEMENIWQELNREVSI